MEIKKIIENKHRYMKLLLMADPDEGMINKYLNRGDVFTLCNDGHVLSICVVTRESKIDCEIKNIVSSVPGRGYGHQLMDYIINHYTSVFKTMYVGTGNSSTKNIRFYKSYGFSYSHTVKNFFTKNYQKLIFEDGVQCVDMIYYKKEL